MVIRKSKQDNAVEEDKATEEATQAMVEEDKVTEEATSTMVDKVTQEPVVATAASEVAEVQLGQAVVIPHAEMAMPQKMPSYRVTKTWNGSLNGSVCTLFEGKLINPRLYGGLNGIEKLKQAGVMLAKM